MNKAARAPLILASSHPPAEACAPRADFTLLSQALGDAPLLFPPTRGNPLAGHLERRTASDLRQAIAAYRRHRSVSVYVSLSEKVGLPLSLLLKARRIQTPHVLVAHHLTSAKKRALQERRRWLHSFARIVVLSEPQADYLRGEAEYPDARITLLLDSVDTDFWRPQGKSFAGPPFVLGVGQERRDYATLFAAAQELPLRSFSVVAGSAWAARSLIHGDVPPSITIRHGLSYADLRTLYDIAFLVVVPLQGGVSYAAGANGLLEAMAMAKPVVLTDTPGLSGYARQGETACIVPPSDPGALAHAIRKLQRFPDSTARLSDEARRTATTKHSLETYVAALAGIVREVEGGG